MSNKKSITEALAEVKKNAQLMEATPAPSLGGTVTSQNAPAASKRFQGSIADYQKLNPGATVGQAMNAIQGKTAIKGGANDPNVIRAKQGTAFDPAAPRGGTMPAGIDPAAEINRITNPTRPLPADAQQQQAVRDNTSFSFNPFKGFQSTDQGAARREADVMSGNFASPNPQQRASSAPAGVNPADRGALKAPSAPQPRDALQTPDGADFRYFEDGPMKKRRVAESNNPLIDSFLKLQEQNPENMFEAAKKAKKDWDKDGKIESEKDEVWGSRFRAAKKAGKMEEETVEEQKWIQKAIKKPGALHKQLGVPEGEKIPAGKLKAAAEKGGKLGKRARLAKTLANLHKEEAVNELINILHTEELTIQEINYIEKILNEVK